MRYKKLLQESHLHIKVIEPVVTKEIKSFKTYLENRVESIAKIDSNKWITLTDAQKETFGPELIEIVGIAYANTRLGSFVRNQNDVNLSNWIVLSLDNGQSISCAIFYRGGRPNEPWVGNKIQGIGHDGKTISRRKVVMHLKDLLEQNGWWIECRAAVAKALHRAGAPIVTDEEIASAIFPGTHLHMTDDNGSYTRSIAGRGTALTDETIFGKPVLKQIGIREYIAEFEAGDILPDVLPGGNAVIASHFKDRAGLRLIPDKWLVQTLTQAGQLFKNKLEAMGNRHKFVIVAPEADIGVAKIWVRDQNGKQHYQYVISTVHKTLYHKYMDDDMLDANGHRIKQDVLRLPSAIGKKMEWSPNDTRAEGDQNQYTRLSKVLTFNANNIWYSITRGELHALSQGITEREYRSDQLIKQAIAIASTEPEKKRLFYTKVANEHGTVYVAKVNNSNLVLVDGVFNVIKSNEITKIGSVNVKFIPIAAFTGHEMHKNPISENMFKQYLEKIEAEKPAPVLPSMLVEEPEEDMLLTSIEKLREHFRIIEGTKPEITAHRVGDSMWIDWFSVPNRGQGEGRRTYEKWEQNLPQDIKTIRLHESNAGEGPSHGFWDAMGFDYEFPDDDNQMIKRLDMDIVNEAKDDEKPEEDNLIIDIGNLAEKYECSLGMIEIELRRGIKVEMANEDDFMKAKDAALKNLNKSINYYKKDSK